MHESLTESVLFKNSQTALCGVDGREQGLVLQTQTWQGRGTGVKALEPESGPRPTPRPSPGTTGIAGGPVAGAAEGRNDALHFIGSSQAPQLPRLWAREEN